jgi:nucleoside phosphorylase
MNSVDVLIIAALKAEFEAAKAGIREWISCDPAGPHPYLRGDYVCTDGRRLSVALARPTRMSGRHSGPSATALSARLKPGCLAMSGVCAGNPAEVALGDVVVAEMTYQYDEGKLTVDGFVGDHRQYQLDGRWIRAAQDLDPTVLPSYGPASEEEAAGWLLERLYLGQEPTRHPAFDRYFPPDTWLPRRAAIEAEGLITRAGPGWALTAEGRSHVERIRDDDPYGPDRLPFAVAVAPMASGNYVAKDGRSWERLKAMGVRTVTGLDMEAATIATVAEAQQVPRWLVVKGVMDHADPNKDDRYKRFAARASAEVLYALLDQLAEPAPGGSETTAAGPSRYTVTIENSRGVQIGDHNVQHNTFTD